MAVHQTKVPDPLKFSVNSSVNSERCVSSPNGLLTDLAYSITCQASGQVNKLSGLSSTANKKLSIMSLVTLIEVRMADIQCFKYVDIGGLRL
jgi:hypothetical protein